MASIARDPKGKKRILFMVGDGSRKTIRLGKTSLKQAEAFKIRLEDLISTQRQNGSLSNATASWVAGLPDDVHDKLASAGLVTPRKATEDTMLGEFLDSYLQSRTDLKPNSQLVYGHTRRTLIEFFGYDKSLRQIKSEDAQAWRAYLTEQDLSPATVNKRAGNAKVFFNVARKRKLILENPFKDLESRSIANKSRQYFLERKDTDKIMSACPDAQWRLIFALARYGGLRCPSEILALQWSDVNWDGRRLLIHSPKTERHEGRESRIIPIFPEILPHLQDVFDAAKPGTSRVITRYRYANQNLRTTFQKIIKRAGLKPWPRLFQNLRATRETELASRYPLHVVTAWIGNTARIAERHYLQVPDEFFDFASGIEKSSDPAEYSAAQKEAHLAQKEAQYAAALSSKGKNVTMPDGLKNAVLPLVAAKCISVQDLQMETKGIEPSFPRCDRGVLPLHHVPENNASEHYFTRKRSEINKFLLGMVRFLSKRSVISTRMLPILSVNSASVIARPPYVAVAIFSLRTFEIATSLRSS